MSEEKGNIKNKNEIKTNKNQFSESIKLNDYFNQYNNPQKEEIKNNIQVNHKEEIIKDVIEQLSLYPLKVETLDYYGNAIPLGAFCNGITFFLFGLFQSRALVEEDTFLWSVVLLFGGFGQITAAILEFIKKRPFPSFLYLIYGLFCMAYYMLRIIIDLYGKNDLCVLFGSFSVISIPLILASIRTNLMYLLQTIMTLLFFLTRCIGEGARKYSLIDTTSGIFQSIGGLISLYIWFSQTTNQKVGYNWIKLVTLDDNNDIDFRPLKTKKN